MTHPTPAEQAIAVALEQLRGQGIDIREVAEALVGFAVALYGEAHGGVCTRELQLNAAGWLAHMAHDVANAAEQRIPNSKVN